MTAWLEFALHCEADEVVDALERVLEQLVMPRQRRAGVDVERRADLRRDVGDRHVLGAEDAAPVEKMIHRALSCPLTRAADSTGVGGIPKKRGGWTGPALPSVTFARRELREARMAKTVIIEEPGGPEKFRIVDREGGGSPDRARSASGTRPAG